jgi:hypothetical protein
METYIIRAGNGNQHQEKPPLENYLQFVAISFLLSKPGKFKEMEGNILYFLGWFNILVITEIAV